MRYVNESMQGFPKFSTFAGMVEAMRKIVETGFGEEKPSAINGNQLTFNNGYQVHEEGLYLVSDGVKDVYTKVVKVDVNNIYVVEDITTLNSSNIKISTPKINGWTYSVDGNDHIFTCVKYRIIFNTSTSKYRVCNGLMCSPESASVATNSNKFSIISNEIDSFFIKTFFNADMIVLMFFYENSTAYFNDVSNSGTLSIDNMIFKTVTNTNVNNKISIRFIANPSSVQAFGNIFGLTDVDFSENLSFTNVFHNNSPIAPLQIIGNVKRQNHNDLFLSINNQKIVIVPAYVDSNKFTPCVAFLYGGI